MAQSGGLGLFIITLIFIGIIVGSSSLIDIEEVKSNWQKYRCRPDVMLMAKVYGHDANENLEYCLKNGFDNRAAKAMGPFYIFLAKFVSILVTLLDSINSIRMTFATIVGTATKIFSEFSMRIRSFLYRIQIVALRIKYLMGRIGATMTSLMFMGASGIKATQNFGNTFLFNFLDTFCFDPETPVSIVSKGIIPIKDVKIGDVFTKGGDIVTSTFQFFADGQDMVKLSGDIIVSTNHYLLHKGKWIQARDHPEATPITPWSGGFEKPIICLNTNTHQFPVGTYTFRDYDETEEADYETMKNVLQSLNNKHSEISNFVNYDTCCHKNTLIKLYNNISIPAFSVSLGDKLSFGTVVGLVKKEVSKVCEYRNTILTPGTAVWHEGEHIWKRVSDLSAIEDLNHPEQFYSFIVSPSACIETHSGVIFRDYLEVHSPETEKVYTEKLKSQ
jgi:hypothetical protein